MSQDTLKIAYGAFTGTYKVIKKCKKTYGNVCRLYLRCVDKLAVVKFL